MIDGIENLKERLMRMKKIMVVSKYFLVVDIVSMITKRKKKCAEVITAIEKNLEQTSLINSKTVTIT